MAMPMPTKQSGRIILVANVTAKPGEAENMISLLAAVRKLANSAEEKGNHTYRTCRGVDGNEDKFIVFEEYDLPNGIKDHVAAAPFQALANSGKIADLAINYFEEFDGEGKFVA